MSSRREEMSEVLTTTNLTKHYGRFTLDGISLSVPGGCIDRKSVV